MPGIQDQNDLIFFESVVVSSRILELNSAPIRIKSTIDLFEIHKYLFQDVYSWAGEARTIEISKDSKQFFPTSSFSAAINYIDSLINEFQNIDDKNKPLIARSLALMLDHINYFHPFREGNGRAQREFIRSLALDKNYRLNLNPPDNKKVYQQYMRGTIESDIETLSQLMFENLTYLKS